MELTGAFDLQITDGDFMRLQAEAWNIIRDDETYPRKVRSKNFYKKLSRELLDSVRGILSPFPQMQALTWHFEVFHSGEAVGLHNDRNYFREHNELCERGLILPLEWSAATPVTRFYDLTIEEKVNWDGSGFETLDGRKIAFDAAALARWRALEWRRRSVIFFDSRQIHDAGEFQNGPADFKLSINALGYSHPEASRPAPHP